MTIAPPTVVARETTGGGISAGRSERMASRAVRTSSRASCTSRSRGNSITVTDALSLTVEVRCRTSAMAANASSILRVASVSRVDGVAPGSAAVTVTIGRFMSGMSCTGRTANPMPPATVSSANSRREGMGFRIAQAEKFMVRSPASRPASPRQPRSWARPRWRRSLRGSENPRRTGPPGRRRSEGSRGFPRIARFADRTRPWSGGRGGSRRRP